MKDLGDRLIGENKDLREQNKMLMEQIDNLVNRPKGGEKNDGYDTITKKLENHSSQCCNGSCGQCRFLFPEQPNNRLEGIHTQHDGGGCGLRK